MIELLDIYQYIFLVNQIVQYSNGSIEYQVLSYTSIPKVINSSHNPFGKRKPPEDYRLAGGCSDNRKRNNYFLKTGR